MKDSYRVRAGVVLIKPDVPVGEQKTGGGLIIPQSAAKEEANGAVVIVGSPLPGDPIVPKVGDTAYFREGAGQEVVLDGEKHRLLNIKEVLYWEVK